VPGTPLEDMELVGRARDGDVAAFTALVRRYQDRIYNVTWRMLADADDAADVAQETFLAAWEGLGRFRGDSALYTWLYRIAVNKALLHRRARSSKREYAASGGEAMLETLEDCADGPAAAAERNERALMVQRAITGLPEDLKAVVVLRDIEGLAYEEIAEVLEIAVGTVKSRLHRARLALRDALKGVLEVAP